jgi:hypothetical protein
VNRATVAWLSTRHCYTTVRCAGGLAIALVNDLTLWNLLLRDMLLVLLRRSSTLLWRRLPCLLLLLLLLLLSRLLLLLTSRR